MGAVRGCKELHLHTPRFKKKKIEKTRSDEKNLIIIQFNKIIIEAYFSFNVHSSYTI